VQLFSLANTNRPPSRTPPLSSRLTKGRPIIPAFLICGSWADILRRRSDLWSSIILLCPPCPLKKKLNVFSKFRLLSPLAVGCRFKFSPYGHGTTHFSFFHLSITLTTPLELFAEHLMRWHERRLPCNYRMTALSFSCLVLAVDIDNSILHQTPLFRTYSQPQDPLFPEMSRGCP